GAWFGGFQALMPLIGYLLASTFAAYITSFSSWIAFALLVLIGANMIREGISNKDEVRDASFGAKSMAPLAIATSIDALAVGVTFAFLPGGVLIGINNVSLGIIVAVVIIGVVTFALSMVGLKVGDIFGAKYKSRAEIAGGVILILIGIKTLLDYFGIV
ncbi:MAG: manganese efflux pump MntP family protein, partial [Coriobacteriales bacterium]|nr:manganese efflux pump MntP family protein [Coriobacteriales bacterium]